MITCSDCNAEIGVENPTDDQKTNEEIAYQIHKLTHAVNDLVEGNKK